MRVFFSARVGWLLLIALVGSGAIAARDLMPLPDPLTLTDALAQADAIHPGLELAAARRDGAAARLADVTALTGTQVSAVGRLRGVEPSRRSDDSSNNDSSAQLLVRKRLYDFGYSSASRRAAELYLSGQESEYLGTRQQRRLDIMAGYFDVLLADLRYARDNEAMATAYVAVDKARDRGELGQLSDVAVLALEAEYQQARSQRVASEAEQRATRARLANALNRPDELPANLVMPADPDFGKPLMEFEAILADVMDGNPALQALRAASAAGEQAVAAADVAAGPVLSGEASASVYERRTSTTHPLGAGLVLEVPLYTGGVRDAKLAAARAERREARAREAQHRLALRQNVLDHWLELSTLRVRMEELDVLGDYRELYLDRSRALYELEVTTDLGDAMVQTSTVRLQRAETVLRWLLTEAKLRALAGRLINNNEDVEPREEVNP